MTPITFEILEAYGFLIKNKNHAVLRVNGEHKAIHLYKNENEWLLKIDYPFTYIELNINALEELQAALDLAKINIKLL